MLGSLLIPAGRLSETAGHTTAALIQTPQCQLRSGFILVGGLAIQLGCLEFILSDTRTFGYLAGRGWEWVGFAYLLGGLWLWQRRIIGWQTPFAFLVGITLPAALLWLMNPAQFANPLFHLFSGGTLLGAFFIVTDPVSGCTTPKGKLIFGCAAGLLAYLIRVFGGYPDGVAFAVLILNICVPLIDHYTQPPIFGMKS